MERLKRFIHRLRRAVMQAFMPALKSAVWIIKLTVPITLATSVLSYLGFVDVLSEWLTPMFSLMGLSGESSLVFISSALGNLYSAIGVMATIGLDFRSAVILASMSLICHNMIIETAIQHRTGARVALIIPLRIGVALICGIVMNLLLPQQMEGRLFLGSGLAEVNSWRDVFVNWVVTIVPLILKMLSLIISLNIIQTIFREFRLLDMIAVPLRPLMRIFGLPLSTSFLWIICNVVGLTYGGAAIIDEINHGDVSPEDARLLNTHVAISHSLLEDTLIFFSIGLPLFWLLAPRIILAITAVWIERFFRLITKKAIF